MENTDQTSSIISKLTNPFRVVIYDDDTLAELRSTKVTGGGILVGICLFFIVSSLLTAVMISYTPLKYLVPGYADVTNNKAYMEVQEKLAEIETELDAQRTYTNGLKNMLNPTNVKLNGAVSNIDGLESHQSLYSKGKSTGVALSLDHYYFHSPLKGEVSAGFDRDQKHFGVDIVAQKDSPVKSILDGVVITADWSVKTGNTISVQHRNDIISVYKHNSKLLKNIGENVKAGEAIAIIGNTGLHTNGPHVHFELWNNRRPIDPSEYIEFN